MEALKRELKKVGSLSLFFFIGYGYILILMKLFLKEFSVDVSIFTKAVIYPTFRSSEQKKR
jgi:fucose permease